MNNIDYLKEKLDKLNPKERQELDDYLLNGISKDADNAKKNYGLITSEQYLEKAQELKDNWGKMQGLSSGYPSIDKLTKGFVAGELIIIGGATSNGKTSLAVNMAQKMLASGQRVLFVTMEMTRTQLTSRMMFIDDNFSDHAALLAFQRSDEFNWESVDGLIANAVQELDINLVIVDHLHHFTRELNNVSEDLGRITKEFQKNAHRHNIPIMVISHTRKGEGTSIDDLRGSSYIAQDSDIVLMVSRKEEHPDLIGISIQKNRNRGYDLGNNEITLGFHKTKIIDHGE